MCLTSNRNGCILVKFSDWILKAKKKKTAKKPKKKQQQLNNICLQN